MIGKALRAAAADRDAAAIVGVRVETTVMLSFAIAAFAGALAGAIITPLTLSSYDQGVMFGFKGSVRPCWAASEACQARSSADWRSVCWKPLVAFIFHPISRMQSPSQYY